MATSVEVRPVSFKNSDRKIVGNLYLPEGGAAVQDRPSIVIATPGSSVKEQIGAVYAGRLAERGFVALTFDPSFQGESEGEPRDFENPSERVEDLRCAVDFLMTLPSLGEERVGLLGICAGGGYAVNAALIEHRFRAVGTVVAGNIGRAFREMQTKSEVSCNSQRGRSPTYAGSKR